MAKGVPEDVLNVLPSGVISRFLPAVPGAATRRGIATLTGSEFGPGRGYKIWPSGCGVPQFHAKSDAELEQRLVAPQHLKLAVPKRHPLTKLKKLRLRHLTDVPFSGSQGAETRCSTTS